MDEKKKRALQSGTKDPFWKQLRNVTDVIEDIGPRPTPILCVIFSPGRAVDIRSGLKIKESTALEVCRHFGGYNWPGFRHAGPFTQPWMQFAKQCRDTFESKVPYKECKDKARCTGLPAMIN